MSIGGNVMGAGFEPALYNKYERPDKSLINIASPNSAIPSFIFKELFVLIKGAMIIYAYATSR
jgi:hypothetical protein